MNAPLWFFDHGVWIFPIDRRNKAPLVPAGTSQFNYRCTREEAERMGDYGVPLGRLGVADSDTPEAESWVVAHLPDTPFKVTTARGRHRYYLLESDAPHFFHRAGHTVEFRHRGQYVVGPGSTHASGAVYTADTWSWNPTEIPLFPVATFLWDDRPLEQRGSSAGGDPLLLPPIIQAGERHDLMFKLMRSLQARGVTEISSLLTVLRVENQAKCSPPINDEELERYIRRVSKYPDRAGFDRAGQDDWTLLGGLLDVGTSLATAEEAARTVNPGFVMNERGELPEILLPSQPSQPFKGEQAEPLNSSGPLGAEPDMPTCDIAKPSLSCCRCGHSWAQKRKKVPRNCPRCRSSLWNREPIVLADEADDGEEIFDLNEDDDALEVIDLEDDDAETVGEDDEDVEIIDEAE